MGLQMIAMFLTRNVLRQLNAKISRLSSFNNRSLIAEVREEHLQITKIMSKLNDISCHYYFVYMGLLIVLFVANIYLIATSTDSTRSKIVFIVWDLFGLFNMFVITIPALLLNEEADKTAQLIFEHGAMPQKDQPDFAHQVNDFFSLNQILLVQAFYFI